MPNQRHRCLFVEALKQQAKSHIEKLDAMALIVKHINVVVSAEDAKKSHTWIGPEIAVPACSGLSRLVVYVPLPAVGYPTGSRKHRRVVLRRD